MGFLDLMKQSYPALLKGLFTTLQLTLITLVIASFLGLFFGLCNISKKKYLKWIATIYIDLIRGTPLLVQAFFVYFGLSSALNIRIDATVAGVATLSLNAGAYMAEIVRGGIQSIGKGQMEAARSLGLSSGQSMRKVILPQAVRNMLPSIINQFIITLKDTSILSVIGLRELTQSGKIIIANTYKSFWIWGVVAVMYFVVITILSKLSRKIERGMRYGKSKSQ